MTMCVCANDRLLDVYIRSESCYAPKLCPAWCISMHCMGANSIAYIRIH